jgi:excisionase family DNA binding protein
MRAKDALVEAEACSARQLDLFSETLVKSQRTQGELVVAKGRLRSSDADPEVIPTQLGKASKPPNGPHSAGDRSALTRRSSGGQRALARLAVSPDEAAEMLGVSRDYFDEHVIDELRVVRRGRRILVSLTELKRWLDRAAACATFGRSS